MREFTGKPAGIKAVLGDESWLDDLLQTVQEMGSEMVPDFITLDSADGGCATASA